MSTDHRPSVDQLLTDSSVKYRLTIDQVSAKCRRGVGEMSVNEKLYRPRHIWNDYRSCLDRVSTDYRPTIDRYIDRLSTECRPTIDRVTTEYRPTVDRVSTDYRPRVDRLSTECRPLYRPISTHSKQDPRNLYSTGAGVHTHTPVTNTQRFAITFWKGKIIQGFKLEQIVK